MPASILHTITGLNVGGAEIMLARLIGELEQKEFSTTVLSLLTPGPLAARIEQSNAKVISIGMTNQPKPLDLFRLIHCVSQATPDLLHGWMYHGNVGAMLGSMLSLRLRPVIWSVHHTLARLADESPLTRRLIHLSARLSSRTSAISYCSRVAADDHEKLGFDPRRSVIIPNGTDCSEFRPSTEAGGKLRQLLGLPSERIVVGHVARFHPMKDQVSLVHAISQAIAKGHDIQGVIIGEGHVEGPVRAAARELGIDARITTLGVRNDIPELLPGFDVFVLSSAWGEAFSLAVGEAMAAGVPAVVTAVGDSPWLVGSTGVVVPPNSSRALAAGLIRLLEMSTDQRRALGEQARLRIVEYFSLSLYVRRHLDLYRIALEEQRPSLQISRRAS